MNEYCFEMPTPARLKSRIAINIQKRAKTEYMFFTILLMRKISGSIGGGFISGPNFPPVK